MLLNGQFFIYVVVKINIILLRKHDTQWKATRVLLKIIFTVLYFGNFIYQ